MTEFISRKYGNEGYEIIIKTDSHEHYRATEDFARRLIDHAKPMRNADKIRAMSDEELAEFLCDFRACDTDENTCIGCKGEQYCRAGHAGTMEWIKQPAEAEE